MSLTSALTCPRTPLRRFLDRELSAGTEPIRESFRAQHTTDRLLHLPDGVGTEAGTVGTAIDHRLRPPFTATPVAGPAADGVRIAGTMGGPFAAERMAAVGREPLDELTATARTLQLDDRTRPIDRAHGEEQHLARLPLAAAWGVS